MQEEIPLVSVMMNCFNGEKYLHEAIDSVIKQTYQNWELIFWDNQSSDSTAEIVQSYNDDRIKYHYAPVHTDLGGGRARAWEEVKGEFVAILDADDIWYPEKLETQLTYFSNDLVGIVISNTLFFSDKYEEVLYSEDPITGWVTNELLKKYYVSLETVMFRKKVIDNLDVPFDANFSHIADFDLIVRASTVSKLAYVPQVLAGWRMHANSESWVNEQKFIEEKRKWFHKYHGSDFLKRFTDGMDAFYHGLMYSEAMASRKKFGSFKAGLSILINSGFSVKNLFYFSMCALKPLSMLVVEYRRKKHHEKWFS